MFSPTLPHPPLDSRPKITAFSFDGRYGLPNSVREALLHLGKGEAALVMDALLYCGIPAGKVFTFQSALARLGKRGFQISKALVRRGLNSGIFPISSLQTQRPGRPPKLYHMPEVRALVDKYANGRLSAADMLEPKDMYGMRLYRQGLHREFIKRAPGIYSRAFLGKRLAVGNRTTRIYDLRIGIRSIRRLSRENLLWIPNWEAKVGEGKVGRNWLRVTHKDGRCYDTPLVADIVRGKLWKPYVQSVHFISQICNRYVYAPEPDWADHQFLYQSDDERVFAHSTDPNGLRVERLNYDPVSATLSVDRKAYRAKSDPIPAWMPPEMVAKRVSSNPFLPRYMQAVDN